MQHTFTCKLTTLEQIDENSEAQNNGYTLLRQHFIITGIGRDCERYNIGLQIASYSNGKRQTVETKNYKAFGNETITDNICLGVPLSEAAKYVFSIIFFDYERI